MIVGKKEAFILALLASRPLYGLSIVKLSRDYLGRGTVYVRLDALEDAGLVHSTLEAALFDARRVYTITEAGRTALWEPM